MKTIIEHRMYRVLDTGNVLSVYKHKQSGEFFVVKVDKNLSLRYYISCGNKKRTYPSDSLSRVENDLGISWMTNGRWTLVDYSPELEGVIEKYSEEYPEYFI